MIEKLEIKTVPVPNNSMIVKHVGMDNESLFYKINELVDAVNHIKEEYDIQIAEIERRISAFDDPTYHEAEPETRPENVQPDAESRPVNVQDPYAEQRQWIGKLCRFWDDNEFITSNDWAFGILTSIDKGMQYQYCCNENCNFKHCEPVSPDDDIIYKGGKDE